MLLPSFSNAVLQLSYYVINTFGNEYIVTIFQLSHSYFLLSFCNHVNEQCIFARYEFYDIINNQYYDYHVASYRNYSAFTNRIVKMIKSLNLLQLHLAYYTIYIVDANNVVLDALGIEKSCQIAAKI